MPEPPDLNVFTALAAGAKFMVSNPESPADQAQRHRIETIWTIAGIVVIAVVIIAGCVMAFGSGDPEIRKGGVGLIGAALTGVLGFMAGRGSK